MVHGPRSVMLEKPLSSGGSGLVQVRAGKSAEIDSSTGSSGSRMLEVSIQETGTDGDPIFDGDLERQVSQHSSDGDLSFDGRMRLWAERNDEKKRLKAQRKKMGFVRAGLVATTAKQIRLSSNKEEEVEELLGQKGLPIASLESIGSGTFAKVYKGLWTKASHGCEANSTVAVKLINVQQSRPRLSEDGSMVPPKWLEREVKTSHVQHHENLVRVIESFTDSLPYTIVLEYCRGGSLHALVTGDPSTTLDRFSWHQRLKAALDIAAGMTHLHEQRIVHRDLKPPNVLLVHPILTANDVVHVKVCDFGLARYLPDDECQTVLTRQVGSWHFMAPEIFSTGADNVGCKYDEKVDVYSYGMLLYHLVAGKLSFACESMSNAEFVIFASDGGRPSEDAIPEGSPEVLRVLMKEAWQALPSSRPSFFDITNRLSESQAKFRFGDIEHRNKMLGGFGSLVCCAGRYHS